MSMAMAMEWRVQKSRPSVVHACQSGSQSKDHASSVSQAEKALRTWNRRARPPPGCCCCGGPPPYGG